MSAHVFDATTADFQQTVLDASRGMPVVVDFWAPWCGPCRTLGPILEKLAEEYGGRFVLAKVNSDENQELSARYGVRGIPNVKAFVNGEMVDEFTGALPESGVREFLDGLIPSPADPLRREAAAAIARGEHQAARQLLERAIGLDPRNESALLDVAELDLTMGFEDEAREIVEGIAEKSKDQTRIAALRARLALAAASEGLDAAALAAQVTKDPANLEARLKLANAQAANGDYRAALENLLEIVRRNRKFQDEVGRKTMLTLFAMLGAKPEHDDLVREFRLALGRTLN